MGSSLEEKVARIEAILGQVDKRLNHLESDISSFRSSIDILQRDKVDKWEVRIWFIILITLITIITFLRV
jgi:hypothetical protein